MITTHVDLRSKLLDVRNQGRRSSCLAFAATVAHEHRLSKADALSVEYLFYSAVRRMPGADPAAGTTMAAMSDALAYDGQPVEATWPYQLDQLPLWSPPTNIGTLWRVGTKQIAATFDDVALAVQAGLPVIFGLIITARFLRCDSTGLLPTLAPDAPRTGHALVAVGYGTDASNKYLLARNSWGERWGLAGHAWLAEDYIAAQLRNAAVLQ